MTETMQRSVKSSEIKKDFKYEVSSIHGGDKLLNCFQCGTCTSDCPIARFSDTYRPRQLIRMAQIGLREQVLSSDSLWLCASCFTCSDRCPQDVEVASVIRVLKNLAAQQAFVPQVFKELGTTILETGYAYRIPERRLKKREDLGLPPLPKSNLETLNTILGHVHFQKSIGRDR